MHDRMLGGVAAGAAVYLDVDPTLVRIAFVILGLLGGLAIPLYLAALAAHPRGGRRDVHRLRDIAASRSDLTGRDRDRRPR